MHSIQALWDTPSSALRARLESARHERAQGLAFFEVNSGKVDYLGSSGSGDLERALFRRLERTPGMGWTLPDVVFFLNTLDEPRVFAHEKDVARSFSNVTTWQSYEPSSATAELQKTCSQSQSSSRSGNAQDHVRLSFISNTTESADYCLHPDLFQQHDFLQAPETFITTRDIIPVLSSCAAAHFSDIIIPSVYYELLQVQDAASGLNPDLEPPWEDKEDVLYWSESSTGMHETTENWRTGHRQRLAMDLALSSSGHRNVTLLTLGDSGWTPHPTEFARLSHFFDVSIRGIVQCDEPACAAMSAAFRSSVNDPAAKAFEYKFVLDIDGNTWSGRYH